MIYEMFKAFAVDGLGWWEFAFAVVVTALLVHCACWLCGYAVRKAYSYVQDNEAAMDNFMVTLWGKVWPEVEEIKEERDPNVLHGWYKSSEIGVDTYWRYRKYKAGKEVNQTDTRPSAMDGGEGSEISGRDIHIAIGIPFYLSITFLIFDRCPILVISIVGIYATLRLARTVVRVSKRVVKVEEKVNASSETEGK